MRRIVTAVVLSLLLGLRPGGDAVAQDTTGGSVRVDPDLIAELIFGVYCAEEPIRTEDAPETASGVVNIVPELPEIRFSQTVVPAALDVGFGVLSRAPSGMVHDPVTITVTHPPFPGQRHRGRALDDTAGVGDVQPHRVFLRRARRNWCWGPGRSKHISDASGNCSTSPSRSCLRT
jgi:hypothetical protein